MRPEVTEVDHSNPASYLCGLHVFTTANFSIANLADTRKER
jgi:hypothetical protein